MESDNMTKYKILKLTELEFNVLKSLISGVSSNIDSDDEQTDRAVHRIDRKLMEL